MASGMRHRIVVRPGNGQDGSYGRAGCAPETGEWLRACIRERDVVIRDILHRNKNTMQFISGLLYLQADAADDDLLHRVLKANQIRIDSIFLVYERLYRSEGLKAKAIDFSDYVQDLLSLLYESHDIAPGRIGLSTDVQPLSLAVDTAVPLGLIVTELVSNSLRHAFSREEKGHIFLKLKGGPEDGYVLTIRDDGRGIPGHVDFREPKTFGLRLVNMLSRQLRATVEIAGDRGWESKITFSVPERGETKKAGGVHG